MSDRPVFKQIYQTAYQIAKEELQQREREAGNDSRLAGN
jgi:hypothetical protein